MGRSGFCWLLCPICLLRKFFLLPTTRKKPKMTDFHKRKTLQRQKRLQRFLVLIQFLPDSDYFSAPSTSAISRAVAVTIRIPVSLISSRSASSCRRWVILPGGLLQKELIYRDIVTLYQFKKYL